MAGPSVEGLLSPRRERRRAAVWSTVITVALAGLVYGPSTWVFLAGGEPNGVVGGIAGLGGLLVAMAPMFAADCIGPAVVVREGERRYLTGLTIAGWRSVDLDEIAVVRLRTDLAEAPAPTLTWLIVMDTNRARLSVAARDVDAARVLAEAIRAMAGRAITVSPRAARLLELDGDEYAPCRNRSSLLMAGGVWLAISIGYGAAVGAWLASSAAAG